MFKSRIYVLLNVKHRLKLQCPYCSEASGNSNNKPPQSRAEKSKAVTISDLKWRQAPHEKAGEWYSMLKVFASDHNQTRLMKLISSPIDLSPKSIKNWWNNTKEKALIMNQTAFMPQRIEMLGHDLAAAHFIVHRDGKVKFYGDDLWIKKNDMGDYKLPDRFDSDKVLQCIDCTSMKLYYEGLANFRGLRQLEWLSLKNSRYLDDWCMDRLTNIFKETLLYLNIEKCPLITERGLGALCKMKKLETLVIDDVTATKEIEMTCLLLQELFPKLQIKTNEFI